MGRQSQQFGVPDADFLNLFRALWGTESELTAEIECLKSEVVKAEKALDHATPEDIRRGISTVRRTCREYSITGVFGSLYRAFARTVICRELDVATRVARTDGLDCITIEGDQVGKKGGKHDKPTTCVPGAATEPICTIFGWCVGGQERRSDRRSS
ncbi:unnamed protein product [Lactuca virosa]|uniref:Uncharacterized protein n=1 Tax=Lactuca virosa TaxID=75947 RepID=A0AAU9MK47_9ASTR|nr:unnamed protein product [Lactuca virosa]